MNLIREEVFNSVSWDIRNKMYEWWKPSLGDVFESNICGNMGVVDEELTVERYNAIHDNTTPLLSIGQLIEFIEWRTKQNLLIRNAEGNKHFIHLFKQAEQDDGTFLSESIYREYVNDLLKGLWECACKVAEDSNYDK